MITYIAVALASFWLGVFAGADMTEFTGNIEVPEAAKINQ